MKIGIDATAVYGPKTGIERYIINIINNIFEIDKENQYVVYCRDEKSANLETTSTRVLIRSFSIKNRKLFQQFRLPAIVKRDHVNVMFYPGNTMSLCSGIPSVLTIHDIFPLVIPNYMPKYHSNEYLSAIGARYWRLINVWSARRATNIISVSESTKSDLMRFLGAPESKITVIYEGPALSNSTTGNVAELREFRERYDLTCPYILCVGTGTYKNVEGSIEAFTEIKRQFKDPLTLIITGPDERLRSDVKAVFEASAARDSIVFTGFFPEDDMPSLFRCAELLLFPSFYEGFGIPVLEAFACGLPVVTSNVSSMPEVSGNAALLVNPYNSEEIAAAVRKVLGSEKLRARLRADGLARLEHFSWQRAATQTLNVLQRTTRNR